MIASCMSSTFELEGPLSWRIGKLCMAELIDSGLQYIFRVILICNGPHLGVRMMCDGWAETNVFVVCIPYVL